MHDGMPYGRIQGQGQGHSREVDRQSPTGLIFAIDLLLFFCRVVFPFLPCDAMRKHGLCCDPPRVGSGVVRIDPLRCLAGCRTRRLNQV